MIRMLNPFRWIFDKVSSSLEREVEHFETFTERAHGRRKKRRRKEPFSFEKFMFRLTGASRIPASRRLVIGTYLAIMVFWGLIFLEAWHVALLHEPEWTLISGISSVVTFLAGTYWGRHA